MGAMLSLIFTILLLLQVIGYDPEDNASVRFIDEIAKHVAAATTASSTK